MKVWIVEINVACGGFRIFGVYSTKDKADEVAKAESEESKIPVIEPLLWSEDGISVVECEVDR